MTLFNVLESGTAAKARTNMLKLSGDLDSIIDRLSAPEVGSGHIQAAVVEVTKEPGEEWGAYYQRVDSTIKDFIRHTLSLPASTGVHYSRFGRKGKFGFLYLGTQAPIPGQVQGIIAQHSFDPRQVIQALVSLKLKLSYLADVHKNYEIDPVEFNADLYVGMVYTHTARSGHDVFEALEYELFFSKEHELVIKLMRVVMECSSSQATTSRPVTDTGVLMFDWAGKRFQRVRTRNANTSSDRNYMAFATNNPNAKALDQYHNSINYHQTDCLNRLARLLKNAGVEFTPIVYEATHQVKAFLEGLPTMTNPLWLLDTAADASSDPIWRESISTLADKFGASQIVTFEHLPAPTELTAGITNYLVVSEKVKTPGGSKNGSSIFSAQDQDEAESQSYNTFWQALEKSQSSPSATFDYYTSVKLHRFSAAVDTISQGLNLDRKKMPSQAAVEKSLQELALKEAIFRDKALTISGASLPAHSLQLMTCRKDQNSNIYVQVLDVTVAGETIKIDKSRRFDKTSKGEFNYEFKHLSAVLAREGTRPFETLWDDAFFIRDKQSNMWLNAYNTSRVPAIVGNTLFDNQVLQDSGTSPSRKVGIDVASLPYYLTPTRDNQRHSIFIQDNGAEGACFFVASNKSTNGTIAKQSLAYNVVITDEAGTRVPVLTHPLGELFFSSFTYDIVKLREAAKTSIFQKIVDVCLRN